MLDPCIVVGNCTSRCQTCCRLLLATVDSMIRHRHTQLQYSHLCQLTCLKMSAKTQETWAYIRSKMLTNSIWREWRNNLLWFPPNCWVKSSPLYRSSSRTLMLSSNAQAPGHNYQSYTPLNENHESNFKLTACKRNLGYYGSVHEVTAKHLPQRYQSSRPNGARWPAATLLRPYLAVRGQL